MSYNLVMTIDQSIRRFLEHLEVEEGKSRLTLRNYQHYLETFSQFCREEKIGEPTEITNETVRVFRLWLNRAFKHAKTGLYVERSRKTQNYYLIALRSYLKYLLSCDMAVLPPEKVVLAHQTEREISVLEPDELGRILATPDLDTLQGRRDRALMEMLYSTGLRVSELTGLDRTDVHLDTGEFAVRGKRGKVRVVFVSNSAKEAVERYLAKRRDDDPALFIRIKNDKASKTLPDESAGQGRDKASLRLTPRSVQRIISHYAVAAGIAKPVTPHVFRHVFATDLLQNGADLRSVQALLGHSSITSTQIYTHVTNPQLHDVHRAFHDRRRTTDE